MARVDCAVSNPGYVVYTVYGLLHCIILKMADTPKVSGKVFLHGESFFTECVHIQATRMARVDCAVSNPGYVVYVGFCSL